MAEQQKINIPFDCTSCNYHNQYLAVVYVGSSEVGSGTLVVKCKHCGADNKLFAKNYKFAPNNSI